jgi:histidyl-tRNA synthetase
MSLKFAGVKGMNDLLPPNIATWQHVERVARELFSTWGYGEIRTPIVEDTALFERSVGEVTDIVQKEMYTFQDKGERSLTMRPEGTAPAARAYIEHGLTQKEALTRWFYTGPMFRYERMKTGRYRQFYQLGAEAYGAADPAQDVEIIALAARFLDQLGVPGVRLHLNSLGDGSTRPQYLEALRRHFAGAPLSADSRVTLERNPLRLLDSKEDALRPLIASAPAILDFIDPASRAHFDEVQRLLKEMGLGWVLDTRLVRGLDYYTRTTFEFLYEPPDGENVLGTAGTVCGGGRYDGLVKALGGPEKPAVGFAMGLDRLVLLLEAAGKRPVSRPQLFLATMEGSARDEALRLVFQLRDRGHRVDFDPRGGKLKRQLDRASHVCAQFLAVYGDSEQQTRTLRVKELELPEGHPQKEQVVSLDGLEAWLSARATPGPSTAPTAASTS